MWGGILRDKKVIVWAKLGGIMRDKMADKNVIVGAKVRGILSDNIEDNMVIVWANEGAY